ncbi:MAG TPA: hypothetical protein VEL28_11900 [Candidatus Binatia bacterium]|nr:hypothetical protein [Candidatus Binatia bacterium]
MSTPGTTVSGGSTGRGASPADAGSASRSARARVGSGSADTSRKWIVDARYDQLFLLAAWALPLLLWAIAVWLPYGLLIAFVLFVLLDNSHQVATLPLTIFDRGSMQRFGRFYVVGGILIAVTAIVLAFFPGTIPAKMWASLVLYWGAFHIIRQHYGFLRLYQARDKPSSDRVAKAEVIALYSGSAFPYLMNLSQGWIFTGVGENLFRVPMPIEAAWAVLAIFAASFAYTLAAALQRGAQELSLRLLHLVLVVSNFWLAILWVAPDDVLLAVLFITSYHDLQYHAIVWLVGRARSTSADTPVLRSVQMVFGSVAAFAATIVAGGLLQAFLRNDFQVAASVLPATPQANAVMFGLFTSYSYMHYLFDGKMWKMREDPRLRIELGLTRR